MTKVRKQKRQKKYRYNVNRKRMKKKLAKTPSIHCEPIKKEWQNFKTVKQNLRSMGLAYDANIAVKMPQSTLKPMDPALEKNKPEKKKRMPRKIHVAQELEEDANAPRERTFRLPNGQVLWFSYLLDKYGENYKAMERDHKNYYQETWRQLRAKIKQFKGIPEQFNEYLKSREERERDNEIK